MESATLVVRMLLYHLDAQKSRLMDMATLIQNTAREYESKVHTNMTRNFWIRLFLLTGIDTRWQRNAWMKICKKNQSDLDRENAIFLWEKSVLLDKPLF